MKKNISKIALFSVSMLLICAVGIVYAAGYDTSDLNAADGPPGINEPVKVTKLPGPDDMPEDIGGYVLDVSDIDIEEIRALPCDLESIRMERIIIEGPVTLNTENNRVID